MDIGSETATNPTQTSDGIQRLSLPGQLVPDQTGSEPLETDHPGRSIWIRVAALSMAGSLIALLLIAGSLTPSAEGMGTHRQLGLPPCSSLVMLGVRCPSCGMTTSWSYFVRGMWWQSARTNSGGFLLALGAIALIVYCLSVAKRGRVPGVAAQRGIALTLFAIMVVTLTDWAIRLTQ